MKKERKKKRKGREHRTDRQVSNRLAISFPLLSFSPAAAALTRYQRWYVRAPHLHSMFRFFPFSLFRSFTLLGSRLMLLSLRFLRNQSNAFKRLVPLFNRVLIEKVVAPTKSVGGILLPESAVPQLNQVTNRAVTMRASTLCARLPISLDRFPSSMETPPLWFRPVIDLSADALLLIFRAL